jgi:hypothetical protein
MAIDDEIAQNFIDTFPASDPPFWTPLTRIGIPNRKGFPTPPKR